MIRSASHKGIRQGAQAYIEKYYRENNPMTSSHSTLQNPSKGYEMTPKVNQRLRKVINSSSKSHANLLPPGYNKKMGNKTSGSFLHRDKIGTHSTVAFHPSTDERNQVSGIGQVNFQTNQMHNFGKIQYQQKQKSPKKKIRLVKHEGNIENSPRTSIKTKSTNLVAHDQQKATTTSKKYRKIKQLLGKIT